MEFSEEVVRRRLRLGEDGRWEFKQIEFRGNRPVGPNRDSLADELAAFANGNGGVLLCGVTDDGRVQGMTRVQLDAVEQLVITCADSIRPAIEIDAVRVEVDDKAFLAVEVAAGYALHDSPGGSYRRSGSSKRRMGSDERLRLAQRRAQSRFLWFDEQPVPETGFGSLDQSLWKPLVSAQGAAAPDLALAKLGLLTDTADGPRRATVAGILLCSRSPEQWLPNACITATRYRGADRASGQVDAQTIGGPLNRQIADAVAFAVRNMQVAAHKDPARLDLPQYSERAIFEAVVNAVAHRDYSMRGSRIRLSLFSDRLEIQSPGTLPNSLTVENIADRQATRNEVLASVLGRMPAGDTRGSGDRRYFMERRGDGVPVILNETRGVSGKPAQFRVIAGADVLVVLPSAPLEPSPAHVRIAVRAAGRPLPGSDLLVLFPNHTWKRATTDDAGIATAALRTTELPLTVYAAAAGHAAHVEREWTPCRRALAVELAALPDGGSVIFPEAAGSIPGLTGTLHPVRDAHGRIFVSASNIAINQGQPQPVPFVPGEELRLADAAGRERRVRIVDVTGRSALVEYRP